MHLDDPGRVKILWNPIATTPIACFTSCIQMRTTAHLHHQLISNKQPALSHTSHPVVIWKGRVTSGWRSCKINRTIFGYIINLHSRNWTHQKMAAFKQWHWFQKRFGNLSGDFLCYLTRSIILLRVWNIGGAPKSPLICVYTQLRNVQTLMAFDCTGWLIGILTMARCTPSTFHEILVG